MSAKNAHRYPFGYSTEELERLGNQHRVWEEENRLFLSRAGFSEGDAVVDLGCGPGFTTLELARRVGPKGRVIAVDRDGERSIPHLRQQVDAAGLSNVETLVADLEHFDLPGESVDGVYGRWVLMYLPEREAEALTSRIAKWLRPGGACASAEFCNYRHIHIHPPSRHLATVAEALMQAAAGDRGCNPEIGNILPGLFGRAGLDAELNVVTKAIRPTTPEWCWPDTLFRQLLPPLTDEGRLARETLDEFIAEWEERSRDQSAVFYSTPVMEVVARRPYRGLQA